METKRRHAGLEEAARFVVLWFNENLANGHNFLPPFHFLFFLLSSFPSFLLCFHFFPGLPIITRFLFAVICANNIQDCRLRRTQAQILPSRKWGLTIPSYLNLCALTVIISPQILNTQLYYDRFLWMMNCCLPLPSRFHLPWLSLISSWVSLRRLCSLIWFAIISGKFKYVHLKMIRAGCSTLKGPGIQDQESPPF